MERSMVGVWRRMLADSPRLVRARLRRMLKLTLDTNGIIELEEQGAGANDGTCQ